MNQIKYIPDKAINLINEDLLGTSVYVETINKIIKNCETPYTIGLFGSWGSGKSSIIKTLQEELDKQKSDKIKVFIYDAWKYSKDDFRRTFILELRKFLGLDINNEEELFYKDKIEDIQYKPKFDKYFFIILSITFILVYIFGHSFLKLDTKQNAIGASSIALLISSLFSFLKQSLIYHRISITTSRLFAPEKFEECFRKILKEKKEIERLVIAIDNIDRCNKEQTFEILLTIKNFLEVKNIIFIIPLDDKELKKYLQMHNKDSNEFLRKLFNTVIYLKNFSNADLYDFGLRLWEKYNISLPHKENVISLVCQEFSKNPRKIIQFLNILQTEHQLAKIQEEKGLIPYRSITNNIEMLVKILIIREEYPDIFEKILDNTEFIKEINKVIRNEKLVKKDNLYILEDNTQNTKLYELELSEEQYRFFKRTSNIELDGKNLEPFLLNKDVFKDVPDKIYQMIISQDWDNLKEILVNNKITFNDLLNFIEKLIDDDVYKKELYDTTGFNICSLIFKIITDKEYKDKLNLPLKLIAIFDKKEIYKNIYSFSPKEFICSIKWFESKGIKYPLDNFINEIKKLNIDNTIKKDKKPIQFIKEFIHIFKDNPEIIEKIKDKFSDMLIKDFSLYHEFKEVIENKLLIYLLNENCLTYLIETLNKDNNQNFTKEKVEIISSLKDSLSEKTKNQYLVRIIPEFLGTRSNDYNNTWHINSYWVDMISGFIEKCKDQKIIDNLYNFFNNILNSVISNQNIQTGKEYISILGELYLVIDDGRKNIIVNWIDRFSNSNNKEIFLNVIKVFQDIVQKTEKWLFVDNIINYSKRNNIKEIELELIKTINLMLERDNNLNILTEQQKDKIINNYFDFLFQEKKDVIESIIKISNDNSIAEKVIEYITKIKETEKLKKVIPLINKLVDIYGFDKIYPKIKELLAISKINEQKLAIIILYEVKNKIPKNRNKLETIKNLLYDIKVDDIENDISEKLKQLKDLFDIKNNL